MTSQALAMGHHENLSYLRALRLRSRKHVPPFRSACHDSGHVQKIESAVARGFSQLKPYAPVKSPRDLKGRPRPRKSPSRFLALSSSSPAQKQSTLSSCHPDPTCLILEPSGSLSRTESFTSIARCESRPQSAAAPLARASPMRPLRHGPEICASLFECSSTGMHTVCNSNTRGSEDAA
jgi:hypothetical protein